MTEMTTSSVGAIGRSCDQTAPLGHLFDRLQSGEASLTGEGSFERVLVEELNRSSDQLGFAAHQVPGGIQSVTPWGPIATGAHGILDGGRDAQNGAFDRAAARQESADLGIGESDRPNQAEWVNYAELHPQNATFDTGVFSTLQADVHDRGAQPLDCSDGLGRSWSIEGDILLARDPKAGSDNADPLFDLPMDHVFFNGDGRPILLSSVINDIDRSAAAGGGQLILPDGAVLAYDP